MDGNGYIMEEGEELQESLLITFEGEDGSKKEYAVMGMFVADVFQYMALMPTDPEETDVVLMPYEEGEDGSVEFRDFYSEEEYERADEAFHEFMEDYQADDFAVNEEDIAEESELDEGDYEDI